MFSVRLQATKFLPIGLLPLVTTLLCLAVYPTNGIADDLCTGPECGSACTYEPSPCPIVVASSRGVFAPLPADDALPPLSSRAIMSLAQTDPRLNDLKPFLRSLDAKAKRTCFDLFQSGGIFLELQRIPIANSWVMSIVRDLQSYCVATNILGQIGYSGFDQGTGPNPSSTYTFALNRLAFRYYQQPRDLIEHRAYFSTGRNPNTGEIEITAFLGEKTFRFAGPTYSTPVVFPNSSYEVPGANLDARLAKTGSGGVCDLFRLQVTLYYRSVTSLSGKRSLMTNLSW